MKVLVCGSRSWIDGVAILQALSELPSDTEIIHGAARGADCLAAMIASDLGMSATGYPADWSTGKSAGFKRNQQMIDQKPDLVVAFHDGVSRGTQHTLKLAEKAGISVKVVTNSSREATKAGTLSEIFKRLNNLGVKFPDGYCVIDTETSGPSPAEDFITQIGWCVVRDRTVETGGDMVLDWTRSPAVNQNWLRARMEGTRKSLESKGGAQHTDMARMAAEGVPPTEALQMYWEMLDGVRASGGYLLAHNGFAFDIPMLRRHFQEFLQKDFDIELTKLMDSGLMEKAAQAGLLPWENDTLNSYFKRVSTTILRGVYWSLDRHCVAAYDLVRKCGLNMEQAHGAGFDCRLTHLVFEEQRALANGAQGI